MNVAKQLQCTCTYKYNSSLTNAFLGKVKTSVHVINKILRISIFIYLPAAGERDFTTFCSVLNNTCMFKLLKIVCLFVCLFSNIFVCDHTLSSKFGDTLFNSHLIATMFVNKRM